MKGTLEMMKPVGFDSYSCEGLLVSQIYLKSDKKNGIIFIIGFVMIGK